MDRIAIFTVFFFFFCFFFVVVVVVIFTSLIENLTRGTATLQNEILTVLRFHHSL